MSNIAPAPRTVAEYEAEFEQILAEAQAINERMDRMQADSKHLKAETDTMQAEAKAKLAKIDAEWETTRADREHRYNRDMAERNREYEMLLQEHARLLAERGLPPGTRRL